MSNRHFSCDTHKDITKREFINTCKAIAAGISACSLAHDECTICPRPNTPADQHVPVIDVFHGARRGKCLKIIFGGARGRITPWPRVDVGAADAWRGDVEGDHVLIASGVHMRVRFCDADGADAALAWKEYEMEIVRAFFDNMGAKAKQKPSDRERLKKFENPNLGVHVQSKTFK